MVRKHWDKEVRLWNNVKQYRLQDVSFMTGFWSEGVIKSRHARSQAWSRHRSSQHYQGFMDTFNTHDDGQGQTFSSKATYTGIMQSTTVPPTPLGLVFGFCIRYYLTEQSWRSNAGYRLCHDVRWADGLQARKIPMCHLSALFRSFKCPHIEIQWQQTLQDVSFLLRWVCVLSTWPL